MKYLTKEFFKNINNKDLVKENALTIYQASIQRNMMQIMHEFPTLKINFAGIKIKQIHKIAKNIIIEFDIDKYKDATIKSITLKNAKVLISDDNLLQSRWIAEELYYKNNKYELHILLKKRKLMDLVIECDKGTVTYTEYGKILKLLPKNDNDLESIKVLDKLNDKDFSKLIIDLLKYIKNLDKPITQDIIKLLIKKKKLVIPKVKLVLNKSKDKEWKDNINKYLIPYLNIK